MSVEGNFEDFKEVEDTKSFEILGKIYINIISWYLEILCISDEIFLIFLLIFLFIIYREIIFTLNLLS